MIEGLGERGKEDTFVDVSSTNFNIRHRLRERVFKIRSEKKLHGNIYLKLLMLNNKETNSPIKK